MKLIPQTEPFFLRDVLFMKRNRGDADANQFSKFARMWLAYGLSATVAGAETTVRRLLETDYFPLPRQGEAVAFLHDVEAVIAGDRAGWIAPNERAA